MLTAVESISLSSHLLPGVDEDYIRCRYDRASGREIESGKFASPVSSSSLVANAFGWFNKRSADLPAFPGLPCIGTPIAVDVEVQMRFPWRGGLHPWLDAVVETDTHVVGVESKRFEPYRDAKNANFSDAYDRPVWAAGMEPYLEIRDRLKSGLSFQHLDAAQLVKHALGLSTQAERKGKTPALVYLFAEPPALAPTVTAAAMFKRHRDEIAAFSEAVAGAAVAFTAISYREWIGCWPPSSAVAAHGEALLDTFRP